MNRWRRAIDQGSPLPYRSEYEAGREDPLLELQSSKKSGFYQGNDRDTMDLQSRYTDTPRAKDQWLVGDGDL